MHGFTGVLACCFDLLCPGQHSMPSVKQTEHKHDQQVRSSLSGAGPCLLQVCKCFVTLFWITRPILTIFSIQNSSVFTRSASGQKQTMKKRVETTEDLRTNLAKRAQNMLRHHCHGFVHVLIQSSLIKSDTNGGYHEFLGMSCGRFRSNRLWPKDCKRVFYDYFGHVLFLSVFPRRQSIMYNQPPPSCEIETMFTGLASRIITISYNWSLLKRLFDVKMASNCQIVPLAPEKIVIVIVTFPRLNPLPTYSTSI